MFTMRISFLFILISACFAERQYEEEEAEEQSVSPSSLLQMSTKGECKRSGWGCNSGDCCQDFFCDTTQAPKNPEYSGVCKTQTRRGNQNQRQQCKRVGWGCNEGDCCDGFFCDTTRKSKTPDVFSGVCRKGEQAQEENVDGGDGGDVHRPDGSQRHCRPDGGAGTHNRVRQEILSMPKEKWLKVKKAWRDFQASGKYDFFSEDHAKHYDAPTKDHGGAEGFLPYHRRTMHKLEMGLQVAGNDCDIALPYWNWGLNAGPEARRQIFSDVYMGGTSGCIEGGLPGGWHYPANTETFPESFLNQMREKTQKKLMDDQNSCVSRTVKDKPNFDHYQQLMILVENSEGDYMHFCGEIERAHNALHGYIGGNMAARVDKHSPSDPMFYIHHNFIDSIWFTWQLTFPDHASDCQDKKGKPCRDDLQPWVGELNEEDACIYLPVSTDFLDDNRATCLSFEPPADEGACAKLERQIQNGECSVEDLQNMPCIDSKMCAFDEDAQEQASAEFTGGELSAEDKAAFDAIKDEIKCKSMRTGSEEEEAKCMSCDYVCGQVG